MEIVIANLLKEDIQNRIGLVKIMAKLPYISYWNVQDLFGYNEDKTLEVIQLFLNNTEEYNNYIDISDTSITSLGKLKRINEGLNLNNSKIKSFGDLEYVGGTLDIRGTAIEDLGKLKFVGIDFKVYETPLWFKIGNGQIKRRLHIGGKLHS